ncbi:MAG: DUF86 domain-containing protein [Patescibacteria group bacterium]
MVFSKIFVNEKIEKIKEYLAGVKHLFRFSAQEIITDSEKLHVAERLFQLIVDEIIDINQHFIKELGLNVPDDFEGTFNILAKNKILPDDFALKIAPTVGLRNRLVHRYEELNPKLFIESFQKEYPDFEKYIGLINAYSGQNE